MFAAIDRATICEAMLSRLWRRLAASSYLPLFQKRERGFLILSRCRSESETVSLRALLRTKGPPFRPFQKGD